MNIKYRWAFAVVLCGGVLLNPCETPQALAHSARHGGALVSLEEAGTEVAHLEITLNAADGTVSAYLTDASAETPARTPQETLDLELYFEGDPIPAALTLLAQPNLSAGETAGDASEFKGQSDRLQGATEFKATLATLFISGHEISDVSFGYPEGAH